MPEKKSPEDAAWDKLERLSSFEKLPGYKQEKIGGGAGGNVYALRVIAPGPGQYDLAMKRGSVKEEKVHFRTKKTNRMDPELVNLRIIFKCLILRNVPETKTHGWISRWETKRLAHLEAFYKDGLHVESLAPLYDGSMYDLIEQDVEPRHHCSRPPRSRPAWFDPCVDQVSEGLQFLHDVGFAMADIKTDNILYKTVIDSLGRLNYLCYITDFGLSQYLPELPDRQSTARLGTPAYLAPEIAELEPWGTPADVWAFCIMCLEMTGIYEHYCSEVKRSVRDRKEKLIEYGVKEYDLYAAAKKPANMIDDWIMFLGYLKLSPVFLPIYRRALDKNPSNRPTAAEFGREVLRQMRELPGGRWPNAEVVAVAQKAARDKEDVLSGAKARREKEAEESEAKEKAARDAAEKVAKAEAEKEERRQEREREREEAKKERAKQKEPADAYSDDGNTGAVHYQTHASSGAKQRGVSYITSSGNGAYQNYASTSGQPGVSYTASSGHAAQTAYTYTPAPTVHASTSQQPGVSYTASSGYAAQPGYSYAQPEYSNYAQPEYASYAQPSVTTVHASSSSRQRGVSYISKSGHPAAQPAYDYSAAPAAATTTVHASSSSRQHGVSYVTKSGHAAQPAHDYATPAVPPVPAVQAQAVPVHTTHAPSSSERHHRHHQTDAGDRHHRRRGQSTVAGSSSRQHDRPPVVVQNPAPVARVVPAPAPPSTTTRVVPAPAGQERTRVVEVSREQPASGSSSRHRTNDSSDRDERHHKRAKSRSISIMGAILGAPMGGRRQSKVHGSSSSSSSSNRHHQDPSRGWDDLERAAEAQGRQAERSAAAATKSSHRSSRTASSVGNKERGKNGAAKGGDRSGKKEEDKDKRKYPPKASERRHNRW